MRNNYHKLILDLEKVDDSTLKKIIDEAKEDFSIEIKKNLLIYFQNSTNIDLLNEIALIFKDNKVNESVPLLMDKLTNPIFTNNIGTFLYALEGLDCLEYFEKFVSIILGGNLESKEMALNILEKIASNLTIKQKRKALKMFNSAPDLEEENNRFSKKKYIEYAISLLTE